MPRSATVEIERDGCRREYIVWYLDDSESRQRAVEWFDSIGDLFPVIDVPTEALELRISDANRFLKRHPVQERWYSLTLAAPVEDLRFSRLKEIPELRRLCLFGDIVADDDPNHLQWLRDLEELVLYTALITDAGLRFIEPLRSLRVIDLQGSTRVSEAAFANLLQQLPHVDAAYSPHSARDS